MDNSWENIEPSPIEFFHGLLMDKFHEFRRKRTENTTVEINGFELNQIIAECKRETYQKYAVLKLDKAVPKSVLSGDDPMTQDTGFGIEDLKRGVCIQSQHVENGRKVIVVGPSGHFAAGTLEVINAINAENGEIIECIPSFPTEPLPVVSERRLGDDVTLTLTARNIDYADMYIPKTKRTNHERQPASFGKGKNKRRK